MEPVLDEYREEEEEAETEGTGTEPENESERGRGVFDGALTDVDTDQEPQTDGVDTEDGRDVDEERARTPSQSRSSSVRPVIKEKEGGVNGSPVVPKKEKEDAGLDVDTDVFDGYSFKARDSVLLEDEEEGEGHSSEESSYEGEIKEEKVTVALEKVDEKAEEAVIDEEAEEEEEGPKTPEARPIGLPAIPSAEIQPELVVKDVVEAGGETIKVEGDVVSAEGAVDGHVGDRIQDAIIEPPPVPPKPTHLIPGLPITAAIPATTPITPVTATAAPAASGTTTTTAPGPRPRGRKERSGIRALDRYLSDTIEERSCASDASASENEGSDDEDEDWDLIEAGGREDRNGLGLGGVGARVGRGVGMRVKMKSGSLFSRGVVDRYRLKVFGNKSGGGGSGESSAGLSVPLRGRRVVSGMSVVSGRSFGSSTLGGSTSQKEQKEKEKAKEKEKEERRGRTPLTFRKHPREFLRAKSPRGSSATVTAATSMTSVMAGGSGSPSGSNTVSVSAASSLAGILLTPSHSISSRLDKEREKDAEGEKEKEKMVMTMTPYASNSNTQTTNSPGSPSLKSKESAVSFGGRSGSSDQSTNGPYVHVEVPDASASELMLGLGMSSMNMSPGVVGGKKAVQTQQRKMKLKKYKNNAEKVLSLFSSPKAGQQQHGGAGNAAAAQSNAGSKIVTQPSGGAALVETPTVQSATASASASVVESQAQALQGPVQPPQTVQQS